MSFDCLFVLYIGRSCDALVECSDILECDAASTVNSHRRFGDCCCHSFECRSKKIVWLFSSFQNGRGTCFICRIWQWK